MARVAKMSLTSDAMDRFTREVGLDFEAPVVCLSLMDGCRGLMVSTVGVSPPLALLVSWSFMKQVAASGGSLLVTDGRADPRVARNPAVREGTVGAYLGMQITAPDGRAVGTLSLMDQTPRRWNSRQLHRLRDRCRRMVSAVESESISGGM